MTQNTARNAPERRSNASEAEERCPVCSAAFVPYRAFQRFCSARCRIADWEAHHPRITRKPPEAVEPPAWVRGAAIWLKRRIDV